MTMSLGEQFAEVDAVIAQAQQTADGLTADSAPEPAAVLTEQERRDVEEALGLVQRRDQREQCPGYTT
jgi:hypothetical protein